MFGLKGVPPDFWALTLGVAAAHGRAHAVAARAGASRADAPRQGLRRAAAPRGRHFRLRAVARIGTLLGGGRTRGVERGESVLRVRSTAPRGGAARCMANYMAPGRSWAVRGVRGVCAWLC